jgi:hypothetical protein
MKCMVIEGMGMIGIVYASLCTELQAEDPDLYTFTLYPTVGEARICGVALSKLVGKPCLDWTRRKNGKLIEPNY